MKVPTILMTDQAEPFEIKKNEPIKQHGFQEIDIVIIIKPITKDGEIFDKAENIRDYLEKAVYFAKDGMQGQVLIDIPVDTQKSDISEENIERYEFITENKQKNNIDWEKIKDEIKLSKRPVILAGGGIKKGDAIKELEEFSIKNRIPVVTSLTGKGGYDEESEYFAGILGYCRNRCANMFLANSDLLLALGTRLDTRQTGTDLNSFVRTGKIIHVDTDNNELNFHILENMTKVNCDIKEFLKEMTDLNVVRKSNEWIEYLNMIKAYYRTTFKTE